MNSSVGISQLISHILKEKFGLDFFLSLTISTMVVSNYEMIFAFILENYLILLLLLSLFLIFYTSLEKNILSILKKTLIRLKLLTPQSTAEIQKEKNILRFLKYKNKNSNFYTNYSTFKSGNLQNDLSKESANSDINIESEYHTDCVYFNDTLFGVSGYYFWQTKTLIQQKNGYNERDKPVEIKFEAPAIFVVVYSSEIETYIKFINEKVEEYISSEIQIYGCKIFAIKQQDRPSFLRSLEFNFGTYTRHEKEKEFSSLIHRKTLFNKNLREAYDRALNVHFYPEKFLEFGQCRASFLLHGPGGSGKSDFVRRVSLSTGRHIVDPDIVNMNKYQVEQCFRCPPIRQTENTITTKHMIINIGEIDILFEELMRREILLMQSEKLAEEKSGDVLSAMLENLSNGGKNSGGDINTRAKIIDSLKEKIILSELLEIFQGSVPYDSLILIATTNNYSKMINHPIFGDRISKIFRPGRMTPIYCSNLTKEILDEITQFHFNSPFDWSDVNPPIEDLLPLEIGISSVLQLVEKLKTSMKGEIDIFKWHFLHEFIHRN